MKKSIEERFWPKVDKSSNLSGCWEWTAAHGGNNEMYGIFGVRGKNKYAHRISWELANGPIPDGLLVCHKCDNPGCVNPDHLFLGTQKDNVQDAIRKGRLEFNHPLPGSRNGRSRLSEDSVKLIRQLYFTQSFTQLSLAFKFNVTEPTINKIVLNKTWKHIL